MIYVFEDKEDDLLSILFRQGYLPEVGDTFIYSGGCGSLQDTALRQLEAHPNEHILLFVDVVPDNRELVHLYNALAKLYRKHDKRILTLPVVCSEYYFIKSIADTDVVTNRNGLQECLHILPWGNSALLETAQDSIFCRNFEKYCKLFLLKNVRLCAQKTRGDREPNRAYGTYYQSACFCPQQEENCTQRSLRSKAGSYLGKWPCIPAAPFVENVFRPLSIEDIINLNRQLCALHNAKILEFGALGASEHLNMLEPERVHVNT